MELFTLDMPHITSNSAVQFIELTETLSKNAINWSAHAKRVLDPTTFLTFL